MPATTLDTIETAIRTAIEGMTPRYTDGSSSRPWRFYEGQHPVRSDARWYKFSWDTEGYTPGGFMGPAMVDTTVTMSLVVDYGGVPEHVVKRMAEDDHYQLRDVLNRLKSTVDGLRWLEAIDWDFANEDRNQSRIVHQYEVRYMKARA